MTAAAPSVRGDEVPAVTTPSLSKAGFNWAIDSRVVSGLTHPSSLMSLTGIISSLNSPFSIASEAFRWLSRAICSCLSLDIEYFFAKFSAVCPIPMYASMSTRLGLSIGLKPGIGTLLMDSTPPAMNRSPAPECIAPAA